MTSALWSSDPVHSSIGFSVRHLMVAKVQGSFSKWSGSVTFDPRTPLATEIDVEIDSASIDTRDAQRDTHLRSADFLDVEKHPQIRFRSTGVKQLSDARFELLGDLTIRGTTRSVNLEAEFAGLVKDPWGGERAGFSARGSLSRKEFGLVWNQVLEAGGVAVGDRVEIAIELEAVKAQIAQAKAG